MLEIAFFFGDEQKVLNRQKIAYTQTRQRLARPNLHGKIQKPMFF